jgi:CheY-like chemotaxis protein
MEKLWQKAHLVRGRILLLRCLLNKKMEGTMDNNFKSITILMADDDDDDRLMTKEAFHEAKLANDLRFVVDGEELLDYLYHRGKFSNPENSPRPGLILLDLNMPKKDGREALAEIKADSNLKQIPIVVLTTSKAEEDIYRSYHLGVNSYITKPVSFEGMVEVILTLTQYWFKIVQLPSSEQVELSSK